MIIMRFTHPLLQWYTQIEIYIRNNQQRIIKDPTRGICLTPFFPVTPIAILIFSPSLPLVPDTNAVFKYNWLDNKS